MNKRVIERVVSIIGTAVLLASCSPGDQPAGKQPWQTQLVIPWVSSFSGPASAFTIDAALGADMAVEDINKAGGVAGRKLVIERYDNTSDPAQSVVQTKKAAQAGLIMLGSNTSGDGATSGPTAAELKTPFIGGGSLAPNWVTKPENRPWTWANTMSTAAAGSLIGTTLMPLLPQVKKVAVIQETKEPSSIAQWAGAEASLKTAGVEIISRTTVTQGDVDFTAQATKSIAAKPDAIMLGCYAPEAGGIIKELRKQGWKGLIIAIQAAVIVPDVVRIAGAENIEGVLGAAEYVAAVEEPGVKKFTAEFRAKHNKSPNTSSAIWYDTVMIVKDVFESQKLTNDPAKRQQEREAFVKAMSGRKWSGAEGTTTYGNDGTLARKGYAVVYRSGELVQFQK